MPLKFHPEPGTILVCDFTGLREPEMTKTRPVVVISPRLKRRNDLLAIVPLSTTPPRAVTSYQCELTLDPPLPRPFDSPSMWVKADMIYTVAFHRLELIRTERDHTGKRKYLTRRIPDNDLRRVRHCVLAGLGWPAHGLIDKMGANARYSAPALP
ncbi:MAG: type II toxin-antitoxin system PemK/MazF family toxin [Hyphomicrobiales bacterium]|nr:type II toxin-antitoxin system PemK/MazF family toxin [Hyphomicrobiales bacterium]